jgi:hypothetical protein
MGLEFRNTLEATSLHVRSSSLLGSIFNLGLNWHAS